MLLAWCLCLMYALLCILCVDRKRKKLTASTTSEGGITDKQKDKVQTQNKKAQTDTKKAASKKKKASTIKKKAASKKKKMSTKKKVHESTLVKYAHHAIAIYIEIMPYVFYG